MLRWDDPLIMRICALAFFLATLTPFAAGHGSTEPPPNPPPADPLGLMKRHEVVADLARMIRKSRAGLVQARLVLALGHLDHAAAVDPLLRILADKNQRSLTREFAATALGLLGHRGAGDAMFSLDAWFNLSATTMASHEWIRLY